MASSTTRAALRRGVRHAVRSSSRSSTFSELSSVMGRRGFLCSGRRGTDGVFQELTAARAGRTPWIEALRQKEAEDAIGKGVDQQKGVLGERNLEPKRMKDSYHSVILPLARDPWLGDTYLNTSGHIRLGTLFMDLDALSGVIAYKHTGPDVTTVTAAFDRISILHPLNQICDLQLSGQVTYATGRSSMEISLQVAKAPAEGQEVKKEDILISCSCTMVSLDPTTKKPSKIPAIIPETPAEEELYAAGEKNSKYRKELGRTSLLRYTPNDEESDIIHALWQKQLQWHDPNDPLRRPANVTFMEDTRLRTAAIMQPQYRNRHNFMIFGGFLLKQTMELAFCCAASFSHTRPTFLSLDPSVFQNPVPVGSVLYLTATVTFTDPTTNGRTRIQVRVDSKVRNVEHGETKPTGQFNYSFIIDKDVIVMPKSYTEYMMFVDARRRAKRVAALAGENEADVEMGLTE